ncbi:MAG: GIY-YIG nuclease family protein [candidate division WOR-3 bacterium]
MSRIKRQQSRMRRAVYVLILWNQKARNMRVGALGRLDFPAGFYLYVGSGGLNAVRRVQRHLARKKRVRWHIDYLTTGRNRMRPVDAYFFPGMRECCLVRTLAAARCECGRKPMRIYEPAAGDLHRQHFPGFGSSDCRCRSHLFYAANLTSLAKALRLLH